MQDQGNYGKLNIKLLFRSLMENRYTETKYFFSSLSTILAFPKKKVIEKKWKATILNLAVDPDAIAALRSVVATNSLASS